MQDADRVPDVEALTLPPRRRRPRIDVNTSRIVLRSDGVDGICRHGSRRWHVGQHSPVRPPEAQLTVALSLDLIALLVHCSMMSPTQHREIRQLCRSAMCPVPNVMTLSERQATAGEATAFVAMVKCAS